MRFRHKTVVLLLRIVLVAVVVLLVGFGGLGLRLRWIERPPSPLWLPFPEVGSGAAAIGSGSDSVLEEILAATAGARELDQEKLRDALQRLEERSWASAALDPEVVRRVDGFSFPVAAFRSIYRDGVPDWVRRWNPGNEVSAAEGLDVLGMMLCLRAHRSASVGADVDAVNALTNSLNLSWLLGSMSPAQYQRGYEHCRMTVRHLQILHLRHDSVVVSLSELATVESRIPSGADLIRREFASAIEHVEWTLGATEGMFPTPGPAGPVLRQLPLLSRVLVAPTKDTRRNIEWLFSTLAAATGDAPWDAWALEHVRQRIIGPERGEFWYYQDPLGRFFARDMIDPLLDVVIAERSWHALLRCLTAWNAVHEYIRIHGAPPAATVDLIPNFLPSLPGDPFGSEPIAFSQSPNGLWTVYSVGADGMDNGSTAGAWFTESTDGYSDLVLFDPG